MGRWRRNKNHPKRQRNTSASSEISVDDSAFGKSGWKLADEKALRDYLKQYQALAQQAYHGIELTDEADELMSVEIGGIHFPALTEDVVAKPFLALPGTLSSKQRRGVHEICTEIGLYHAAVGETRDDRIAVISVYVDGLEHVPGLEKPKSMVPVHLYRPWYCRRHRIADEKKNALDPELTPKKSNISRQNEDEIGVELIQRLIDQPDDCLRDDLDVLDFEDLETEDLSLIVPPSPEGEENHWTLVDTAEKMAMCVQELTNTHPTEIAFDVESYNKSKYTQLTCLLQITSNAGKEYVIDTLAPGVWDEVGGLAPLFADPSIVKVGHSIGGLDIRSLHRDFGIFTVNAFDTYEASQVLKMKSHGLAAVCEFYGLTDSLHYKELKSLYQACDWRERPLTHPMIQYARYDVHYLLKLRRLMMRDLVRNELWDLDPEANDAEARQAADALAATLKLIQQAEGDVDDYQEDGNDNDGKNLFDEFQSIIAATDDEDTFVTARDRRSFDTLNSDMLDENGAALNSSIVGAKELRLQAQLMQVITRSQLRCKDLWSGRPEPHLTNKEFLSIVQRARLKEIDWSAANIQLYDELVQWRDSVAAELECLPGFIAPLGLLVQIAYKRPCSEATLRQMTYFLPELLEDSNNGYREQLLDIIRMHMQSQGVEHSSHEAVGVYRYADRAQQKAGKKRKTDAIDRSNVNLAWTATLVVAAGVAIALIAARRRRSRA